MADQHQILTDKSISRRPLATAEQYKVRDSELHGFFVLIGRRRKSFIAQGEVWRDGVREFTAQVKLGDFGGMTTREARGKAKEALGAIAKGQRPGEAPKIKQGSITLRVAWQRYRDAHMKVEILARSRATGTTWSDCLSTAVNTIIRRLRQTSECADKPRPAAPSTARGASFADRFGPTTPVQTAGGTSAAAGATAQAPHSSSARSAGATPSPIDPASLPPGLPEAHVQGVSWQR